MKDEAVQVVVADSNGERDRAPMPRWILLVLIVVGVGLIWSIAADDTSTQSPPLDEDLDTAIDGSLAGGRREETWVSLGGAGETTGLRGDVVLSSSTFRDRNLQNQTVWVLRPGGSLVRRDHVPNYSARSRELEEYGPSPIVMVSDRIMVVDGTMSYFFNSDLVGPPVQIGPARWIVAGGAPDLVWLVGQRSVDGSDIDWVVPVDTGDLRVADQIDVVDVIRWPVVAIGDGLIVRPVDVETYGRYAYWSPMGGLEPLAFPDPEASSVLASSGSLVAVASPTDVSVLDIETGLVVAAFSADLLDEPIRSACISPHQLFIAVVGVEGQAFVGHLDTGITELLPKRIHGVNSFGWTASDQLVYITDWAFATALNAYDVATAQNHHIAYIADQQWWLTTGSTC
jgi:hypothetical protein